MDIEFEQEKLQKQCMQFSKYSALVREDHIGPERRALQCLQNLALVRLLSSIQKNAFRLLQAPEEAVKIGTDTLELLHLFSEEYTGLLELEYQWRGDKNNPPEL